MRRFVVALVLSALAVFGVAPAASAHVHGITPLSCGIGNQNSGAVATDTTPAAAVNGGPIQGLIPRDVGQAPLDIGDGGFRPDGNPHC